MKPTTLACLLSLILAVSAFSAETATTSHRVASPDGKVEISVRSTDRLYYNVSVDGREVLWYSPLSMRTSRGDFGINPRLIRARSTAADQKIAATWGLRKVVTDAYGELVLEFEGGYAVVFRAYNDGVAYRFRCTEPGELIVNDEQVEYRFWEDHPMVNHLVDDFQTSYEKYYTRQPISAVKGTNLISLPSLILTPTVKLAVLEADLYNYPGLYLTRAAHTGLTQLVGSFPAYPLKWEKGGWCNFNLKVTERAPYIALTSGPRDFPWRVLKIARQDADLLDCDLVYRLARPAQFDASWVKPGKVAWDWWCALNLTGVDFTTGINNRTYEYFIDFAARHGIEYVIMDEGWSDQFDVLLPTPLVDMEHLARYARERGVRLILWAVWHTMDRQYEQAFALFERWGVAGVKVDFIDRDDQVAVEFYERLAEAAAKHKLLVDFHGCSKPTGLYRTYPNLINCEAVLGNEYNKFSDGTPPTHTVMLPFTRMLAGPMDFTPGGMTNALQGDFRKSFNNPMTPGTRMHQLGMFVLYYAPLQMLCDAPTAYEAQPAIMKFLSAVPTAWDETVALEGKLGEYAVVARQKGKDWFIGGMTDWTGRTVQIDLSRFASGNYTAMILQDGVNAHRLAGDYQVTEKPVTGRERLNVEMKPGGGFVVWLKAQP